MAEVVSGPALKGAETCYPFVWCALNRALQPKLWRLSIDPQERIFLNSFAAALLLFLGLLLWAQY